MNEKDVSKSLQAIKDLPFGARFFKSDFHTHTPASEDARGANKYAFNPFEEMKYPKPDWTWRQATEVRGLQEDVLRRATDKAKQIVQAYLDNGLGLVAITDHNALGTIWPSPEEGDGSRMDLAAPTWFELIHAEAERVNREVGKAALTVLAGVEISTTAVHILAVFPPMSPRRRVHVVISDLLLAVGLGVEDFGRNPSVGKASVQTALEEITRRGGLAIIAHVDGSDQALLDLYPITSGAMKNVLTSAHLSAVEVVKPESMMKVDRDTGRPLKEWIDTQRQKASAELQALAWVQGSDAHALAEFGKRFTYVKMTTPSFSGVRAALLSPSSRLRIGADGDPTSRGRYLYGVALKGEWSGERFIRFNRHLNCVVGRKECGKSRLFDLIRKAAWGGADTPGEVRLFVDRRDEERSQLFCFEADEAGRVSLARLREEGARATLEPIAPDAPEWAELRPRFYDDKAANERIESPDDKWQEFLCKYLGDPTGARVEAANKLFDLPGFLSKDPSPLLAFELQGGRWRTRMNLAWRTGEPELAPFESLSHSMRRIALISVLILTGRSGPILIDEPGVQFDNQDIASFLVPLIRRFKDDVQMVFATSNSNLAINADPDNYVVLESDPKGLRSVRSGFAIDDAAQREALVLLMEGGIRSYRSRGARYLAR